MFLVKHFSNSTNFSMNISMCVRLHLSTMIITSFGSGSIFCFTLTIRCWWFVCACVEIGVRFNSNVKYSNENQYAHPF